ncbi:MAG: hypothetical protein K0R38_1077 [Polyangiaceae bacterium]|jgi:hypothetical protein|nr:hypothetical protein [Polyangiaceae bacterium]
MTRIDLHPEDLLDRAARGVASFADLTRLKQHLAECAVCRVERALVAQAALDAKPLRDEKLLVDRLTRDVSARLASPTARRARRRSAVVAGALVAVCVAGAAAAATLAIVRHAPALDVATTEAPQTASPVALPSALPSTERSDEAAESPSVPAPAESAPPPARPAAPTLAPAANAGELFSRANQARRDGKVTEAARLYRGLQERFAGSHEELVSRVSLGRLLLDRLGDSRGALVQFNSYLASPAGGALREEAMVGRALALGRLGRAGEERAAWQALLDTWPKSTHGKRAQARLVALGAASSTPADAERAVDAKGAGGRAR